MKKLIVIFTLLSLVGCKEQIESQNTLTTSPDVIQLSKTQAESLQIVLGRTDSSTLTEHLEVRGLLDVPPQNKVSISAPLGGFIKTTAMLQGMKVKKGEVLAELEHPDYIKLQQSYLEQYSQLEYLELEYKRQEALQQQNANALKTAQQANANVESTRAAVAGLEAMLKLLHISLDGLKKGNIQRSIKVLAPINGYVTKVGVNVGQYVQNTEVLFELVNLEHMHAELNVFEADIASIKIGQHVTLSGPVLQEPIQATVYLIGKSIGEDRTIQVHCHLAKENEQLIPGSYVTGNIVTAEHNGLTLPVEAVVHYEGKDYAFIETAPDQYKALTLSIAGRYQDKVLLSANDKNQLDSKFVIKGSFQLLGLLKNNGDE